MPRRGRPSSRPPPAAARPPPREQQPEPPPFQDVPAHASTSHCRNFSLTCERALTGNCRGNHIWISSRARSSSSPPLVLRGRVRVGVEQSTQNNSSLRR